MAGDPAAAFRCCAVTELSDASEAQLACCFDDQKVAAQLQDDRIVCQAPPAEVGHMASPACSCGASSLPYHPPDSAAHLASLTTAHCLMQTLFTDAERQGVHLRVTAAAAAGEQDGSRVLHEETLDRAAFQERAGLLSSTKDGSGEDGIAGAAPPPPAAEQSALRRRYSALKPFVIISLSYLLFTTTDGAPGVQRSTLGRGQLVWDVSAAAACACMPWPAACERRSHAARLSFPPPLALLSPPHPSSHLCVRPCQVPSAWWCCCMPTRRASRPWRLPSCSPFTRHEGPFTKHRFQLFGGGHGTATAGHGSPLDQSRAAAPPAAR